MAQYKRSNIQRDLYHSRSIVISLRSYLQSTILAAIWAVLALSHVQSAVADDVHDIHVVSIPIGTQKLVGTLTRPQHIAHPPVVLILPGTGGRRDGPRIRGTDQGLLVRMASLLADAGLASLRLSPHGRGGSDGDFKDTTFERRIEEAVAAVEWLTMRGEFDSESIHVLGHSQGTIIAAGLARRLEDRIKSVVMWAPIVDPLASYRRSMGPATLEKGLNAAPDEIIRWRGVAGTMRAFRPGFFKGLLTADPLGDISAFQGRLQVVTGKRDRWSPTAAAQAFESRHPGKHTLGAFEVGHRMGAEQGLAAVDDVARHTVDWLVATDAER